MFGLAVGRSPLIRSLKQPRGLGGFRCLCYHLELVLSARHPYCRLELPSLALWSPSAHRRIYAGDAVISGWTVRMLLLPLREVVRKREQSPGG
jgi:hypothetical protein